MTSYDYFNKKIIQFLCRKKETKKVRKDIQRKIGRIKKERSIYLQALVGYHRE